MRKILYIAVAIILAIAICYVAGAMRLWIIRQIMYTNMPGWLKIFLWGWM